MYVRHAGTPAGDWRSSGRGTSGTNRQTIIHHHSVAAALAWMSRTRDGRRGSSNGEPSPLHSYSDICSSSALQEPLLSSRSCPVASTMTSTTAPSQGYAEDEQGPSEGNDESRHYAAMFLQRFCNPIKLMRFARRRTAEHCHNLSLSELSGSLGDLGTFIPLTVALARERKIQLAPALFWAGVSNIITGYAWDVPMCVQPMKSISAVALTDVAAGTGTGGDASQGLSAESVTAAGILTGAAVLFLGVTNLMELVNVIVPLTVVCGLQVGVGLRLASKGISDVAKLDWGGGLDCIGLAIGCAVLCMFWLRDNEHGMKRLDGRQGRDSSDSSGETSKEGSSRTISGTAANSAADSSDNDSREEQLELGGLSTAQQLDTAEEVRVASPINTDAEQSTRPCPGIMRRLCCCFNPAPLRPHPVGIYLLLIGSVFAVITLATAGPGSDYDLPLTWFGAPVVINAMENVTQVNWRQGFLQGALPQLPLTTLNSVISVCVLAHSLYPEKRQGKLVAKNRTDSVVTRREVSISVGLMNVLLCPLGSMPNCHGAGGLAGQHRFGARHGTSVVVLGLAKIFLAVFLGASALTLLDALPVAVLGVMLVIAGLELVGTGVAMLLDCVRKDEDRTAARIQSMSLAFTVNPKSILRKNALVSFSTASVIVALKKTHYGAISGWVVYMVYGDGCERFYEWLKKRRRQ